MRVLEGKSLRLEPQEASHAAEMFEVLSDPRIYAHENEPPESEAWLQQRFARLETRQSKDGDELWLNWVARLPSGEAIGYVQATVVASRRAAIAYVFGSRWWGRGLASAAVELMIEELATAYGVETLSAVLKKSNTPSRKLLERLGFTPAAPAERGHVECDPDEDLLSRDINPGR